MHVSMHTYIKTWVREKTEHVATSDQSDALGGLSVFPSSPIAPVVGAGPVIRQL